jgi:hypothetical protein
LFQEISRRRDISPELQIARKFVATVGNQITGGQKQARGHFRTDRGWEAKAGLE